jgi:hypothetical protein
MERRLLAAGLACAALCASPAVLAGCASAPPAAPGVAAPPVTPPVDALDWKLLSSEDQSVGKVKRFRYRVELSRAPTRAELERVSREIIRSAPPHHGIEILYYRAGSDPRGAWTAGRATWWPNGRPGDAVLYELGDYGAHRLALQLGDSSPAAAPPTSASEGIPAEVRRRVYQEVLVLEGQGLTHELSVQRVAEQRQLSREAVEEISWEGVSRGWPLP